MKLTGFKFSKRISQIRLVLFVFGLSLLANAEDSAGNRLAVLNTMDQTQLGLAQTLQEGLGNAAAKTNLFQTFYADYSITGFDGNKIQSDFKKVGADFMSYVYLENTRLSIYLFDASRPTEFIVSSQNFATPEGATVSGSEIELAFKTAFQEVISSYAAREYQTMPGVAQESNYIAQEEQLPSSQLSAQFSSTDVKRLYRELSSISNTPLYVGANVGMSRFETLSTTAEKTYASTVNIGAVLGYRLFSPVSLELGADLFTHLMLHSELRAQLPLGQKYIGISLSLGAAKFMTQPTKNLGYAGSNTIVQGTMVYGPGFGIEIPLLGLNIRVEGRYYTGPTSVFLGTYGIVYSL